MIWRKASFLLGSTSLTRAGSRPLVEGVFAAALRVRRLLRGQRHHRPYWAVASYQLIGNEITCTLDVLNYPLAATMSSVVTAAILALFTVCYVAFELFKATGVVFISAAGTPKGRSALV